MGGGGKGGSTTVNKTEIPPEVLARYNAVNARAETVAQQPYQKYSNDPNAFVAPLSQTQQAGIQNTNAMAGAAQPYYQQATGLAQASAYNVNPNDLNVNQYMNPFTQNVVNATQAAMNQQQGQQLAQQQTDAIKGGAFGGDRAGLQRSILQGQQSLAQAQAIAPLYQQNYNQALGAAQQQQGVNLGAQQANRANLQGVSQNLANLGTNAQQAGLAGAQAQLQAGQQQQQTEQAGKQAMYNQFMQEQGYPFQVAQFLANIATGTGALSGNQSTSTTTGGGGFFSDKRLKENVEKVGETNDGQPIYRYNYKGDERTQIGLMAQDVEKHHPEAVGLAGGYKTVDYKKATKDAVHKAGGGATDAYSMTDSPSSMLAGQGAGLAPITLPAMRVGADIPIRTGADAAEIAALRAPQATGFSPGTMEGKRAELASLKSSIGRASDLGSGPGYMNDRMAELEKFLATNASQGGLVGPEGGSFSRGGYAFGGGPYGVQLEPIQARGMVQAQPGQRPPERNAVAEAKQFADLAALGYAGYKNRPDFLRSAADVAARQQTELAQKAAELQKIAWAKEHGYDLEPKAEARGGLIGNRDGFNTRGYVNSSSNPYSGITEGPLDDTLQTQQQTPRPSLDVKGAPKPPPAKSGLSDVVQGASALKSGKNAFDWASKQLTGEASPTAMSSTIAEAAPGAATATEASTGALGAATAPTGGVIDLTTAAAPGLTSAPLVGGAGAADAAAAAAGAAGDLGLAAGATEGAGLFGGLSTMAAPVIEGVTTVAAPIMAGLEALGPLAFLGFSDERMKHDIKKVGTLFDGQPVYRYAYNGDDKTQMGLLAQKVEKIHPDAVGLAGGMKTVDYEKATDKAAKRGHYQGQGFVVPDEYSTAEPSLVSADGGDETATQGGGGGETKVPRAGLAPPIARPAPRVPGPEDAVVATSASPEKPRTGLEPPKSSKPFFPQITSEGIKDTLSSEDFWVPALAGVGAMLASPNKTLAGAIGSGLVGGTSAYTGLQKQQGEIAKQRIDALKSRFVGPTLINGQMMYRDTWRGDNITQQEYSERVSQHISGKTPGATSPAAVGTARDVITEGAPKIERPAAASATQTTPAAPDRGAAPAGGAKPPGGATVPAQGQAPAANAAATGTVPAPGGNLIAMDQAMLDNEDLWKGLPLSMRPKTLLNDAAAMDEKIRRLEANRAAIEQAVGETDQSKAITAEIASLRTDREAKVARAQQQMTRATKLQEEAASAEIKRQSEVQQQADIIELLPRKQQLELQGEIGKRGALDPLDIAQKQREADIQREREVQTAREKLPLEEEKVAFDANVKRQNDALQAAAKEAKDAQVAKGQAIAALSVMFDKNGKAMISTGPLGPRIANVAAYMSQLGFSDVFIKDFTDTSPSNAQALAKLQTAMAAEIARLEFNGAPVRQAEFLQFLETTPSATLLPEAFKWIVENTIIPKANSSINAYKKVKDFTPGIGEGKNIQGQLFDYYEENPWFKVGDTRLGEEPAARTSNRPPVAQLTDEQKAALAEEIRARRAAKGTR